MRQLIKYLKGARFISILCPLIMLIEVYCDLMQPKILADIINVGVTNKDLSYVYNKGIILVILALIGMASGIACVVLASIASTRFACNLRGDLFLKIQSFDLKSINRLSPSSLIVRLTNDVVTLQNLLMQALRMMVRAPLLFLGGIIMAITINYKLALILLVSVPVLVLVIVITIKKGFPVFNKVQTMLDGLNNVIQENLLGIRVVKNYVKEEEETKKFINSSENFTETNIRAAQTMTIIGPIMNLIMNVSIVGVLWFGGFLYQNNSIQAGSIISFITYITQILSSLRMLSVILVNFSRAKVSVNRVTEVLNTHPGIRNDSEEGETGINSGSIEFENVSFAYNDNASEIVLNDISFKINSGETVAILGGTGAGKTSLVNLIPRLYDPISGTVKVDNRDVKSYNIKALRDSVSMIMQNTLLFSDTIKGNLLWGNINATDEEIEKACKVACADVFINELPEGLDTPLERGAHNLSGGQRQRLSIARALLKKSKILIFDDALSAVDTATDAKIRAGISKYYKDVTCIIIAQRILSVKNADRIFVLDEGRIAAVGTHEELLKTSPLYKEIYSSQLEVE